MRWARPSTTAVLPTPGSPMSTGLFFVRRRQHLHDAADLGVAPDDGVELALAGAGGEVGAVLRQRLERALRVLGGDGAPPAQVGDLGLDGLGVHGARVPELSRPREGEQQVVGGEVGVAHRPHQGGRRAEDRERLLPEARRGHRRPGGPGQRRRRCVLRRPPLAEVPPAASSAGVVVSGCSARARARCAGVISGWPLDCAARWAMARASAALAVGFNSMGVVSCEVRWAHAVQPAQS